MNETLEYINLEYLEEVAEGNNKLLKEMLEIFIKQVPEFVEKMNLFMENKDWYSLGKIAHKAKSSVAIMGMDKLTREMKKLENMAKEGKSTKKFSEFIKQFTIECNNAATEAKNISLNL